MSSTSVSDNVYENLVNENDNVSLGKDDCHECDEDLEHGQWIADIDNDSDNENDPLQKDDCLKCHKILEVSIKKIL